MDTHVFWVLLSQVADRLVGQEAEEAAADVASGSVLNKMMMAMIILLPSAIEALRERSARNGTGSAIQRSARLDLKAP